MSTPVFALGENPHTSAPLFWAKPKALESGIRRLKIVKRGDSYFRAERVNYIAGPRPEYREPAPLPSKMTFAEIPGIRFVPPEGVPRRRFMIIPPAQCSLLADLACEANLLS